MFEAEWSIKETMHERLKDREACQRKPEPPMIVFLLVICALSVQGPYGPKESSILFTKVKEKKTIARIFTFAIYHFVIDDTLSYYIYQLFYGSRPPSVSPNWSKLVASAPSDSSKCQQADLV